MKLAVPISRIRLTNKPDSLRKDFCFGCGYSLQGLELPHMCPECGRLCDPEKEAPLARCWFNSFRAWLWWLRPSQVPAGILYALHDARSIRLSRQRLFHALFLPAALSTLLVVLGSFIVVHNDVVVWYFDKSDQHRTPLRTIHAEETNRLYSLDLHFH